MMDELEKGLSVALTGDFAEKIAQEVASHVNAWNLRLPDVPPLVMDFGLGDFRNVGETEYWIANEADAGYCGKLLFVFPNQTCPRHMHRAKLETFYILHGDITMDYGGRQFEMKTGDVLRVNVEEYHEFTGVEPSLILEVSKPSIISDNYFENPDIPIGGNYQHRTTD